MNDIENSAVVCDEEGCDWKQEVEYDAIPTFHNMPCPKCGKGVIVNDADMQAYEFVKELLKAQNLVDPDSVLPRTTMTIDTSKLRGPKH